MVSSESWSRCNPGSQMGQAAGDVPLRACQILLLLLPPSLKSNWFPTHPISLITPSQVIPAVSDPQQNLPQNKAPWNQLCVPHRIRHLKGCRNNHLEPQIIWIKCQKEQQLPLSGKILKTCSPEKEKRIAQE